MEKASRHEGGRRFRSLAASTPLVSIIIVVFNARYELSLLLESIFRVERVDVEVIVIDGGSTDGTLALLQEWSDQIDYWLSEPDSGIYNAMNKGLAAAKGEYVLHLNAGDKLRSVPSGDLRQCLALGVDVVCCRVLMDGKSVYVPRIGLRMRIENTWHHQGTFYRRLSHPKYDEHYRVYGDFDLNQRLTKAGKSVRLLQEVVAEHQNNGISVSGQKAHSPELWRSVRNNSGLIYVPIAFAWYKLSFLRGLISPFLRSLVRGTYNPVG
jgi:glycosyltransferase involved in cell wall biosynthesis